MPQIAITSPNNRMRFFCAPARLASTSVRSDVLAVPVLWYRHLRRTRPATLADIGVFDSPESKDVLPGAGAFAETGRGRVALVGSDHPNAVRR